MPKTPAGPPRAGVVWPVAPCRQAGRGRQEAEWLSACFWAGAPGDWRLRGPDCHPRHGVGGLQHPGHIHTGGWGWAGPPRWASMLSFSSQWLMEREGAKDSPGAIQEGQSNREEWPAEECGRGERDGNPHLGHGCPLPTRGPPHPLALLLSQLLPPPGPSPRRSSRCPAASPSQTPSSGAG